MSTKILAGVSLLVVLLVVAFLVKRKFMKSPRQMEIQKALGDILKIKMRHHNLIVEALKDGATDQEHTALLAAKEIEVLAAIDVAEKELDIEINKENPTEVGPVKLIKDKQEEQPEEQQVVQQQQLFSKIG